MLTWIAENAATFIIAIVLAAVVGAIIMKMLKTRRSGKSSCGCPCSGCPMSGGCHSPAANKP